jgi:Na+/H+ antiporter NhaC
MISSKVSFELLFFVSFCPSFFVFLFVFFPLSPYYPKNDENTENEEEQNGANDRARENKETVKRFT